MYNTGMSGIIALPSTEYVYIDGNSPTLRKLKHMYNRNFNSVNSIFSSYDTIHAGSDLIRLSLRIL